MRVNRRAFLIGSAAVAGGGLFGLRWADGSNVRKAAALTAKAGEAAFGTWIKIAEDDTVTLYSPHIDFGQGSHTALAQMLADELDADWAHVRVEQAPAELPFANGHFVRNFAAGNVEFPKMLTSTVKASFGQMARSLDMQLTGGSASIRATGQYGMRVVGAATREALLASAAEKLSVPVAELKAANSVVTHAKTGKTLRYGELAAAAAERPLSSTPTLKTRKEFTLIGKSIPRTDIPGKVNGSAVYGMDFSLPDMHVATVMAAPVRGGKLESVDSAPAMAVKGVEKVLRLDDAVVVVASGYWAALKGLRALLPKFSDGGHAALSSASLFAEHDKAIGAAKADAAGLDVVYRVPFLHQAMMEPFALMAHHKNGRLDVWGGLQDPLSTKMMAAKAAGLPSDAVTFHPMIMGGGFGRRYPGHCDVINQTARIAMMLDYPVKLIWSREEEVKRGAFRPQCSAHLSATLGGDGKIASWTNHYAQPSSGRAEAELIYTIPETKIKHHGIDTNQIDGFWRSVNASQHGFYNECFIDELAHKAGVDPVAFRLRHLDASSRHARVLQDVAARAKWGSPLEKGVGRGIAIVECYGSIAAEVIEASLHEDGTPKIHRVFASVDCGTTVNPINAEAQIQGGIIMGLSAAIGEAITLDKGAVVQSNFSDYPILNMAGTPLSIDVRFIESDAHIGGLGEPGLPPAAPALANALFAVTGKRIRNLPMKGNAAA